MDISDDWEKSFLPLDDPRAVKPPGQSDLERFGYAQCAFCGDLLHQDEGEYVVYDDDKGAYFCGENHKTEFYLSLLRKGGM